MNDIGADLINDELRDKLTELGSGYYSIENIPGTIAGAGIYERVIINPTDIIIRFDDSI